MGVETLEAVPGIEARLEMVPDTAGAVSAPAAVEVLQALAVRVGATAEPAVEVSVVAVVVAAVAVGVAVAGGGSEGIGDSEQNQIMKRGFEVLRDKSLNRSIAFPRSERARLGLRGLLPHRVSTTPQMVHRVMVNLERLPRDIDRYMQLSALQERNERLFYRTVIEHIDTLLPLIYTPTVGEACKEFSHIAREPKGIFITPDDRGQIDRLLANWPQEEHPRHCRHRRAADPRFGGSRRQRHGNTGRQTRPLQRVRRYRSRVVSSCDPRRRNEQRESSL